MNEYVRPAAKSRKATYKALKGTFATNMMLAVLAVLTGVTAARLLHPLGEGELTAIQTWPLLLGTLAMLGLDSSVVYFISRQPERGRQFTSTAVAIGLLSSLVVGACAWFLLPLLLSAQQPQIISAARVFLLIGAIFAVVGIPHGSLRGDQSFAAWNLFRVAPGLAWLCILLTSALVRSASPILLSRWYVGAILVCGLPFLVVVNRKLRGPFRPDVKLAPGMLRFGIPSALSSLPQTVNMRLDQMLIIAFLPPRALGLYVVAVSWSGAVAPLLSAVASVLFPRVSAEGHGDRQGHLLARALQGGTLVALITSVPFMALAPIGLPLVFGARFAPSVPSAVMLVPAGAILAWSGIAEEGLRGLGRPTVVLAVELAAAVVTVAALLILLHTCGIFGAAIASLLGYSTVAVLAAVAISRSTHVKIRLLVVPTWPVARELAARSITRLRGRHRSTVRRSPGRRHVPGRHRLGGVS